MKNLYVNNICFGYCYGAYTDSTWDVSIKALALLGIEINGNMTFRYRDYSSSKHPIKNSFYKIFSTLVVTDEDDNAYIIGSASRVIISDIGEHGNVEIVGVRFKKLDDFSRGLSELNYKGPRPELAYIDRYQKEFAIGNSKEFNDLDEENIIRFFEVVTDSLELDQFRRLLVIINYARKLPDAQERASLLELFKNELKSIYEYNY